MPRVLKRFQVELNSADNLRDLLQDIIELADEQIKQAQDEINKLKSSTDLVQEVMDGKSKYAKAINDFLAMRDKALGRKTDVAKIMHEVINHNGNVKDAIDDGQKSGAFNITSLQAMIDDTMQKKTEANSTQTITLKKP